MFLPMRLFDHPLALDWTCRHQDRPLVVEIGLEVVAIGMDPFVVGRDSSPLEWTPSCWIGLVCRRSGLVAWIGLVCHRSGLVAVGMNP